MSLCPLQVKLLYDDVPFSPEERENLKITIQGNVYTYLGILLEGRDRFEEESLSHMRKNHSSGGNDHIGDCLIYFSFPCL